MKNISKPYLCLIWILIFMAFPFSIPQAYNLPYKPLIVVFTLILLCLLTAKWNLKTNVQISAILLLQIITAFVWTGIHHDVNYINFLFQLLVVLIAYLSINNLLNIQIFIRSFIKLVLFTAILATICFFLPLLFNVAYFNSFKNPDGREGYNYIISFTNVYFDLGSSKIIRPSGFFDEPGALAFYITIAILLNDLTNKNKRIRQLLFATGIFTLSVAFYLMTALYLIFQLKLKFNAVKFVRIAVAIIIVAIIASIGYMQLDPGKQDVIYKFTFGRVSNLFSSNGGAHDKYFKSDNRSDLIQISIAAIKDSPIVGQGLSYRDDPRSLFYQKFIGANIFSIFGLNGIIGGIIFSLHVFYFAYLAISRYLLTGKREFLKLVIIYSLLIIQRPDYIGGILPYLVVIMLIYIVKNSTENLHVQNISRNSSI